LIQVAVALGRVDWHKVYPLHQHMELLLLSFFAIFLVMSHDLAETALTCEGGSVLMAAESYQEAAEVKVVEGDDSLVVSRVVGELRRQRPFLLHRGR
jgi:hypothetical protein